MPIPFSKNLSGVFYYYEDYPYDILQNSLDFRYDPNNKILIVPIVSGVSGIIFQNDTTVLKSTNISSGIYGSSTGVPVLGINSLGQIYSASVASISGVAAGTYTAGSGLTLNGNRFDIGNMFNIADKAGSGWIHQNDKITVSGINGVDVSYNTSTKTVLSSGTYRKRAIKTITNSYNLTLDDEVLFVDASSSSIDVNLPTASGNGGKEYLIKRISGAGFNIVIKPSGSEEIDNTLTKTLTNKNESVILISDNSLDWMIF